MEKFTVHTGLVAPLDRENVDTDAIIPKQFLKSIKKTGFGPHLFDAWRYLDIGEPGMDAVRRAGGEVLGDPMDIPGVGAYVSIRDSEGNRVGILEPLPMPKKAKAKPKVKKPAAAKKKAKAPARKKKKPARHW